MYRESPKECPGRSFGNSHFSEWKKNSKEHPSGRAISYPWNSKEILVGFDTTTRRSANTGLSRVQNGKRNLVWFISFWALYRNTGRSLRGALKFRKFPVFVLVLISRVVFFYLALTLVAFFRTAIFPCCQVLRMRFELQLKTPTQYRACQKNKRNPKPDLLQKVLLMSPSHFWNTGRNWARNWSLKLLDWNQPIYFAKKPWLGTRKCTCSKNGPLG